MADYAMTWGDIPTSDDKLWALVVHLSVYVSTFLGPLVLLLMFQDKSKFVRYHAIQALIVQAAAVVAGVVVSIISLVTCGVGAVLYLPLLLVALVPLWGAHLAWNGAWVGFPGVAQIGK